MAFNKKIGFWPLNANSSIFIFQIGREIIVVNIYIDNFILAANNIQASNNLKTNLPKKYNLKNLKEIKTIIGYQITRNLFIRTISIN